eukprot:762891-Hanusia_phi.AAC.1
MELTTFLISSCFSRKPNVVQALATMRRKRKDDWLKHQRNVFKWKRNVQFEDERNTNLQPRIAKVNMFLTNYTCTKNLENNSKQTNLHDCTSMGHARHCHATAC